MRTRFHILAGLLVSAISAIVQVSQGRRIGAFLVVTCACLFIIAFAAPLGETTRWGGSRSPSIDTATPPALVRFVAWSILLVASVGIPLLR
jgi:hypothetical protein